MSGKPRVDRTPEEKWQIVQEGMKSRNVSETCRRHEIAQTLYYRWKDEAEQAAKAALGGKSAAAGESEKDRRIRQLERTLGRKSLEIEILKNVVGPLHPSLLRWIAHPHPSPAEVSWPHCFKAALRDKTSSGGTSGSRARTKVLAPSHHPRFDTARCSACFGP